MFVTGSLLRPGQGDFPLRHALLPHPSPCRRQCQRKPARACRVASATPPPRAIRLVRAKMSRGATFLPEQVVVSPEMSLLVTFPAEQTRPRRAAGRRFDPYPKRMSCRSPPIADALAPALRAELSEEVAAYQARVAPPRSPGAASPSSVARGARYDFRRSAASNTRTLGNAASAPRWAAAPELGRSGPVGARQPGGLCADR